MIGKLKDLRQAVQQGIVVGDGAMGTYLYHFGYPVGISYEALNITEADVIRNIHREYVEAGAQLLETNTFTANREKLYKHGLESKVKDINRAGVRLAREAAQGKAYVVGALGSIRAGKRENIHTSLVARDYEEQISAMLEEGVDGIMFETFYDLEEMRLALQITRRLDAQVPTVCQFAVEESYRTKDGFTLAEAFRVLREDGADIVGLNCRMGPNGILRAFEAVNGRVGLPMSSFPNAGLPDYVDGRYNFVASAEYMAQSAVEFAKQGARIIGGCCGTTPNHIRAIADALSQVKAEELPDISLMVEDETTIESGSALEVSGTVSTQDRNDGAQREDSIVDLVAKRHTVIVELDPPRDLDTAKFMKGAHALKLAGADAVTLADNSLAVTRMSNLALGHLIQKEAQIRPLIHIACRDRNLIGTQSHMMGLDALDIDHVLAVTGDPARFGDLPDSSSVYDLTSFEIIRMIKQLNAGVAFSGKPLKQRANFVVGAAFNPNVKYLEKAVDRLERKIEAGADYIMTQPVYDVELIARIGELTRHLNIPIFIGIMPLASGRNAEYLHNEVPGITLSNEVRARMAGLEGAAGRKVGVEIAKELLDEAMKHFNGIYLITPFMFYEMTVELTSYVWEKAERPADPLFRLT
ncbi:bifunctional homocysteine S-methyltransferase/methylenetetrahydrofolate reductase [Paenibacillus sp. UMB4589-SE434]|uniref:bifunctional homocysteine S-methyltransferase/methylenetetrahydrofolate reductase n=1 Tax=Paenibacillus sp. UMB4589-SE434 TaxID=3046314 RepID=UPI00254FE725|nr:bifunctional homocysteine S-methyltransferase/methylenetetrahydrofolate reductase [Paenibacillus sp. UMB4589-SE434]MDK8180845.1 bifunctional homocysteine S-methyltransferase/methylenetetrahydrofolate reductase [Paenibacillus sp. UMB4589-SE434]